MGREVILGMSLPPKLGAKQPMPRGFNSDYRGSMLADREQPESDDDNGFKDESDGEGDAMLVGCASDILDAQHARDPEAYAEALKAFIQMV